MVEKQNGGCCTFTRYGQGVGVLESSFEYLWQMQIVDIERTILNLYNDRFQTFTFNNFDDSALFEALYTLEFGKVVQDVSVKL